MEKKFMNHCVYSIAYHIVFCPKRRKAVLVGDIKNDLNLIIEEVCKEVKSEIITKEIMPEHVHLFVTMRPDISPHKFIKKIKGKSSRLLRAKFPQLLKLPALWSSSYYCGSIGQTSDSTIKMYIENQKGK